MSAIFTLFYKRGSFAQSEVFGSLSGAMTGAYALINLEGYSTFSIEDGRDVVMRHFQIQDHCHAAKAALMQGRMPARGTA